MITDEGGHTNLIDFSAPVGVPVASLVRQLVYYLSYKGGGSLQWTRPPNDFYRLSCIASNLA